MGHLDPVEKRWLVLLCLSLACCLPDRAAGAASGPAIPQQQQQQQQAATNPLGAFTTKDNALIKGSVIVLDVNSRNPADQGSNFGSLPDCAQSCSQTPGCNSWAICTDSAGCGSGCQRHNKDKPRLNPDPTGTTTPVFPEPAWNVFKKVDRLGPYRPTAACQQAQVTDSRPSSFGQSLFGGFQFSSPFTSSFPSFFHGKPQLVESDKWAFGTCTLKKFANAVPSFDDAATSKGWTSGYVTLQSPAECKGTTIQTCTKCQSASDPASCLECSKKHFAETPLLVASFTPDAAAKCYAQTCDSNASPDEFQSCIFDWVATQQLNSLPPGAIGGGCVSRAPDYSRVKRCLNEWVWNNVPHASLLCGCAPADQLQSCINRLVDDKMHNRPLAIPMIPPPAVGSDCASWGPENAKKCYDDWVMQQQQVAAPAGAQGASCGTVFPADQQSCINDWIQDNVPGALRCEGAPGDVQACLYAAVEGRCQCPGLTPSPAPAASPAVRVGTSTDLTRLPVTA